MDGNSSELQNILPALQKIVPGLTPSRSKGQAGTVAVVGGCRDYTGAPYFAAIAALKMGADAAHVFSTAGAATAIKSYSAELIVHPILHESYDTGELGETERGHLKDKVLEELGKWLERFDCLVIGPGLGRDPLLLECAAAIIQKAKSKNIPLVIDGDGLFLVASQPELIIGYPLTVLTLNLREHTRLVTKIAGDKKQKAPASWRSIPNEDLPGQLRELAKMMQGVTIVQKGETDYITDGKTDLSSNYYGSSRRCAGQGDALSGSTAIFVSWAREHFDRENADCKLEVQESLQGGWGVVQLFRRHWSPYFVTRSLDSQIPLPWISGVSSNPMLIGALAGSVVLRKSAAIAFAQHKRSTLTTNIIECLCHSMDELFPCALGTHPNENEERRKNAGGLTN